MRSSISSLKRLTKNKFMRGYELRNSGFTLAELLLASAILIFALSGVLALYINCAVLNKTNRNSAIAMSHANYIMEEIRGWGFTGLETKIQNNDWDLDAQEIQSNYNLTPLSQETIDASVSQSGDPLGVSVRVDWLDYGLRARNIVLNTLITDYQ
jgi:Tfp pilus assembly protein PilW